MNVVVQGEFLNAPGFLASIDVSWWLRGGGSGAEIHIVSSCCHFPTDEHRRVFLL